MSREVPASSSSCHSISYLHVSSPVPPPAISWSVFSHLLYYKFSQISTEISQIQSDFCVFSLFSVKFPPNKLQPPLWRLYGNTYFSFLFLLYYNNAYPFYVTYNSRSYLFCWFTGCSFRTLGLYRLFFPHKSSGCFLGAAQGA